MRLILSAAIAAAFLEAGAQPPVPVAPPAPPAMPAPVVRPMPAPLPALPDLPPTPPTPRAPRAPEVGDLWRGPGFAPLNFDHDFNFDFNHDFRFDDLQHSLERLRVDQADIARTFERDALHEQMRALEMNRVHLDDARFIADNALHMALGDLGRAPRAFDADMSMFAERPSRAPTLSLSVPAAWLPQDPADSLYRVARDLVNRSQHRNAAETFREISRRFPSSGYTPDAMYWEAYSLYKIGGQNELRTALQVLDQQRQRFPNAKIPDPALATRIQGELAQGGDPRAQRTVTNIASQGPTCDRNEMTVRLEALSALSRMNIDSTTPILRRVMSRRDECSISLRRQAITLMAKNPDAATTDLIIDVLKNDPSPEVRRAALSWLGDVPSERGSAALDEVLRTSNNEELQRQALSALASTRNPRASQALRGVIERRDVAENLRVSAMSMLIRTDSVGAGAYLRTLFPKLESRRLKEGALTSIARVRNDDNQKWLLSFVRDTLQPVDLRRSVLSTLTRSTTTTIPEIGSLFKSVPEFELRQQIISSLSSRKEPEAVDQLISIYRESSDPKLQVQIITILSRRDDPRTQKLLLEILNK